MTLFGWLLILVPVLVAGLIGWGMRDDLDQADRPYDWEADRSLDLRGPMQ